MTKALIEALEAAREALDGMLKHSCVADAHPSDKDPEDHIAERDARETHTQIDAALSAARAAPVAEVPAGWKLVPIEPTKEIIAAYKAADPRRKRYAATAKRDYKAMLTAAPDASAPSTGWRTMESAPRDGTRILYINRFGDVGHCHWDIAINEDDQDCWWDSVRDDEPVPRYWMPALPAPPKDHGGADDKR